MTMLSSGSHVIAYVIMISLLVGGYFLPTIIAYLRHHHNVLALGAFNLLCGWTFVGWIACLVWSLTRPAPTPQPVIVYREAGRELER
jgi:hypothetical protein